LTGASLFEGGRAIALWSMRDRVRVRDLARWASFIVALLLFVAWIATRWVAIDWQNGTRLDLSLDQGEAEFVVGGAPFDGGVSMTRHDSNEDAWQWGFHAYPHSFLVPLWLPMVGAGTLGVCLRGRRPGLIPASGGIPAHSST
jgi:4-amino-4-deoxy-L-arabinose transferase-like glycosyltransferase